MEKRFNCNIVLILSIVSFMLVLLMQYSNVFFYHDDYGYASLSYGMSSNPLYGVDASFVDVLHYLRFHYFHVNGRIIPYLPMLICMRAGLWSTRIFMILVIVWLFYNLICLSSSSLGLKNWYVYLLVLVSYGLFSLTLVTGCHYWFSAAFGYLLPLACFTTYLRRIDKQNFSVLSLLLVFVSAASQEVVGVGVVAFMGLLFLYRLVAYKIFDKNVTIYLLSALAGLAFVVLSPGIMGRAASIDNEWFYQLSLFSRIKINIPYVVRQIFASDNNYMALYIWICSLFCSCSLWLQSNRGIKSIGMLGVLSSGFAVIVSLVHFLGYYDWLYSNVSFYNSLFLLQLIILGVSIFEYLYIERLWLSFILLLAGFVSMTSMLFVPSDVHNRATIFCQISILLVICVVFIKFLSIQRDSKVQVVMVVLFSILPFYNFGKIFVGYHMNKAVNIQNDLELRIAADQGVNSVLLKRLPCPQFADAQEQTYSGAVYIQEMYRNYYGLDKDVEIVYN